MIEPNPFHAVDDDPPLTVYNTTDVGNAERLITHHGHKLHYCRPWRRWLTWDDTRWKPDDTGTAERLAQETVRTILTEALDLDGDQRKKLISHALQSERAGRIRGLLEMAEVRDHIPVIPDQLDQDHGRLNLQNGTLNLDTLELQPHRQQDLITKLAPVRYDPDAQAPRWLRFLEEIFDGDHDLIGFVQRAAGYSLTGDTAAQVFFLLHGTGSNGKSTFLETLADLLGDYAQQAPADTFLEKRSTGIPNDIARLQGARFVTAVETGEQRRLDESLVKRMTGSDRVTARFLRQEFFEFTPIFKVWFATNHKPTIKGTDQAIWRRIRLIPFTVTFPPEKRDHNLKTKLRAELPGILNWAIEGLRAYKEQRLDPPDAVTKATAEYRGEQDILGAFLEEHTRGDTSSSASAGELYKKYVDWAHQSGERAESQTAFGLRLRERGYQQVRTKSHRYWAGLRLTSDEDLFTEFENETMENPSQPVTTDQKGDAMTSCDTFSYGHSTRARAKEEQEKPVIPVNPSPDENEPTDPDAVIPF